jgi:hypothetical protein
MYAEQDPLDVGKVYGRTAGDPGRWVCLERLEHGEHRVNVERAMDAGQMHEAEWYGAADVTARMPNKPQALLLDPAPIGIP